MFTKFGSSFAQSSQVVIAQLLILSHWHPQNSVKISVMESKANFTVNKTAKLFLKFQRYQNPNEAGQLPFRKV